MDHTVEKKLLDIVAEGDNPEIHIGTAWTIAVALLSIKELRESIDKAIEQRIQSDKVTENILRAINGSIIEQGFSSRT